LPSGKLWILVGGLKNEPHMRGLRLSGGVKDRKSSRRRTHNQHVEHWLYVAKVLVAAPTTTWQLGRSGGRRVFALR